jgi:hypothetical protein
MVTQGIQRYSNAQNDIISRARQGPNITATTQPAKILTQVKADAIRLLFENLTALIVAYNAGQTSGGGQTPGGGGTSSSDLSTLLGGPIHGPGN